MHSHAYVKLIIFSLCFFSFTFAARGAQQAVETVLKKSHQAMHHWEAGRAQAGATTGLVFALGSLSPSLTSPFAPLVGQIYGSTDSVTYGFGTRVPPRDPAPLTRDLLMALLNRDFEKLHSPTAEDRQLRAQIEAHLQNSDLAQLGLQINQKRPLEYVAEWTQRLSSALMGGATIWAAHYGELLIANVYAGANLGWDSPAFMVATALGGVCALHTVGTQLLVPHVLQAQKTDWDFWKRFHRRYVQAELPLQVISS